jgi:hypothetical protein
MNQMNGKRLAQKSPETLILEERSFLKAMCLGSGLAWAFRAKVIEDLLGMKSGGPFPPFGHLFDAMLF